MMDTDRGENNPKKEKQISRMFGELEKSFLTNVELRKQLEAELVDVLGSGDEAAENKPSEDKKREVAMGRAPFCDRILQLLKRVADECDALSRIIQRLEI